MSSWRYNSVVEFIGEEEVEEEEEIAFVGSDPTLTLLPLPPFSSVSLSRRFPDSFTTGGN